MRTVAALFLLAVLALGPGIGLGAGPLEKAKQEAEAAKVIPVAIRMYNVQDLTLGKDYPLPWDSGMPFEVGDVVQYAVPPARGGGFGDLFGGHEAGEPLGLVSALTPDVVADLIHRAIDPTSWEEDDRAKIEVVGPLLVITQTDANHKQIAELLRELRKARPMVAVEARWILLDDAQAATLSAGAAGAKPTVPLEVTEAALAQAKAQVIYRGRITCFDRQKVHLISGQGLTYAADQEPVVAEQAIGFDTTISAMMLGVMMELTPSILPDGDAATVDLLSTVSESRPPRTVKVDGTTGSAAQPASVEIELPQYLLQTFRTTVCVPLGKPVLVGGMTSPQAVDGKVLYLVLEVTSPK